VLNPKSISMDELYGRVDAHTKEYTPGVIANIVRDCVDSARDTLQWVVFDGPVDADWIENMNTVGLWWRCFVCGRGLCVCILCVCVCVCV